MPSIYSESEPMDVIRVIHHRDNGTWWAESPDVQNWTAAGDTFEEVRQLAEEGIPWALERDDVRLEHYVPAPA